MMKFEPKPVAPALRDAIAAAIDPDELTALILELANIPSYQSHEEQAGRFVFDWMQREGFRPRKVAAVPHRFNVVGEYGGRGLGPKLLFSSHLDTESPLYNQYDSHGYRPETLEDPDWLVCKLEDGVFHGHAVANDRGPMACFLMAAKALRKAGIDLDGKLYLTACPGEIGPDPVEEVEGIAHAGKDIGALYMLTHGGVAPDFMIAAEGTDFAINWLSCGHAIFRIRLYGEGIYTPILTHPADPLAHPNPIYRLGPLLTAIHGWAQDYERRNRYETAGGTAIPKVQIGAIRGGIPHSIGAGTEVCSLYVEVNMTPRQQVNQIQRELEAMMLALDIGDFEVRPMVVRHGYEADAAHIEPLRASAAAALRQARGETLEIAHPVYASMWRDHNVFNMARIPSATLGPRRFRPTVQDFVDCTLLYALTAVGLCGVATGRTAAVKVGPYARTQESFTGA